MADATLDELKLLGDGVRETTASTPGWGYISGSSSEGSTVIGNGIRTNNRYYLPANDNGFRGRYWSASAAISASARGLYFEYLSTSVQDGILHRRLESFVALLILRIIIQKFIVLFIRIPIL